MCEVCVRARHCIVHYMDMDMDMVHGAWRGAWHGHQCLEALPTKGRRPREHLDERRAERPHVTPLAQPVADLDRVRVGFGLGFGLG